MTQPVLTFGHHAQAKTILACGLRQQRYRHQQHIQYFLIVRHGPQRPDSRLVEESQLLDNLQNHFGFIVAVSRERIKFPSMNKSLKTSSKTYLRCHQNVQPGAAL